MAQEDETWELNFECKAVKDSLEISLRQGNLMKNSLKLLDDFYFSTFDPIKDYDFQVFKYFFFCLSNHLDVFLIFLFFKQFF